MLITALFTVAKCTDGVNIRIHCDTYVYMMNYYSIIEKSKILLFVATWVNADDIGFSEMNQAQRCKYLLTVT